MSKTYKNGLFKKKEPHKSPKIRTKTDFFKNLHLYGQIRTSGNTDREHVCLRL